MNKKLESVVIISKYGSPEKYGYSSKSYRTAKYISEKGINVTLISSDSNHLSKYPNTNVRYNYEKEKDLNHIWIKTPKYKKTASLKRVLSWFIFEWYLFRLDKSKLYKPNVVIVSSLSLLTVLYGLHLKRFFKCKFVLEIRDIHPLTLTEDAGVSPYNPFIWFLSFIEKLGYRKADLIVGTMPNLSDHVKNVLGYEKQVFFSPLGIRDNWNNAKASSTIVDALFPNHDCIVVGYAGSMGRTNALESFIKTIECLQYDTSLYFILVGQGDMKDEYKMRLEKCKNVTIGPKIEQNEVPYFLSKCDILYLSTKKSKVWDYGQSMNKIVDYMMAGKPVVASYSGYPSMLNEAGSGIFVQTDSTEAIITEIRKYALMSADNRQLIGSKGRKWIIENYNNERVCEEYFSMISSLIES